MERKINLEKANEIMKKHGNNPEKLIEVLSELNSEYGYLPKKVLKQVSKFFDLPLSRIYGTSSFYTMLVTEPLGENIIRFCENAPCHVVGAPEVLESLEKELGIKIGETTKDKKFTILTTSCIGICGVGPVMIINNDVYGNLKPEDIPRILANYK
ncbi:MAG: NADH-quinone oxidoreductase subunit NuoE [Actinomycetia bacterium]|nr:NADH-quinone oxidoreductase subunit NuoE [Actinomycetes bacterium]